MNVLEIKNLSKIYQPAMGVATQALEQLDFTMERGEFVAIMGESGSGKSTFLNLVALLDQPTEGRIVLDGRDTKEFSDEERALFRRRNMGYIFQDYTLLDIFTIRENIELPLILDNHPEAAARERSLQRMEELGLRELEEKYPHELSGGQQQRAAVARALVTNPPLLLADEPTGALDSKNSEQLMLLLSELNQKGQSILMVTHSGRAASYAGRVVFMKDGRLFHEIFRANRSQRAMEEEIQRGLSLLGAKR